MKTTKKSPQNKLMEKSIKEKLEFSVKETIQKLRLVLSDEEIITELTPHLTTEELNYLKSKL